jgi:hypothetical protein
LLLIYLFTFLAIFRDMSTYSFIFYFMYMCSYVSVCVIKGLASASLSGSGLAISAVEPITAGVNEFWSGDRVSGNVL